MEDNGTMESMEDEYDLHGYRGDNANGTFAPVDSNITYSEQQQLVQHVKK